MTWDEYYEKFYDWATSTQIRRLSALTSYGSPAEVTEVAMELCDEKAASRLINRALDAGVTFQGFELLRGYSDDEACRFLRPRNTFR